MQPLEIALLYLCMFLFVFGLAYFFGQRLTKREVKNFEKLAAKFPNSTLSHDESGRPLLKGTIDQKPFIVFNDKMGIGKHSSHWIEFKLEHNLNIDYSLFLIYEQIHHKLGKAMNMEATKELELGVPDFDKKFFIKSTNEQVTRLLLNPSIQKRLMPYKRFPFGDLTIQKNHLVYRLGQGIDNDKYYESFVTSLDIAFEMLDILKKQSV